MGSTILTATKTCHDLRDLAIVVRKIEEGDRLTKLRIRIATLFNSFIPIWRAICVSLVLLAVVMVLSAIFLSRDLPHPVVSVLLLCAGATISLISAVNFYHAGGRDVRAIQESIESEMRNALSDSKLATSSAVDHRSTATQNNVDIDQLAGLPYCVQTEGSRARSWQRYWNDLQYSTRVFFKGLEFRLDRLELQGGSTEPDA